MSIFTMNSKFNEKQEKICLCDLFEHLFHKQYWRLTEANLKILDFY